MVPMNWLHFSRHTLGASTESCKDFQNVEGLQVAKVPVRPEVWIERELGRSRHIPEGSHCQVVSGSDYQRLFVALRVFCKIVSNAALFVIEVVKLPSMANDQSECVFQYLISGVASASPYH